MQAKAINWRTEGQLSVKAVNVALPVSLLVMGLLGFGFIDRFPIVSGTPDWMMFQVDINHDPGVSFWGISMDSSSGANDAAWNIRAGIAHLLDKANFVSTYVIGFQPTALVIENPMPPPTATAQWPGLALWSHSWTLSNIQAADPVPHTNGANVPISYTATSTLYNISPDPTGFATLGSDDFCAAADHFLQAGLGTGKDSNCVLLNVGPKTPIDFYIRSDDGRRLNLGARLANAIETLMGATPVSCNSAGTYVSKHCLPFSPTINSVIFGANAKNDWHLYTGGFGSVPGDPPPKFLCDLYWSGNVLPSNYVFYDNSFYDGFFNPTQCTNAPTFGNADSAQLNLGDNIATIPVWALPP